MKSRIGYSISVLFAILLTAPFSRAQTIECLNSLKQPELGLNQQVKGIFYIASNGLNQTGTTVNQVLSISASGAIVFEAKSNAEAKQLWYLVQDYYNRAFALVNGFNASWLTFDGNRLAILHTAPGTRNVEGLDVIENRYLFEFQKPTSSVTNSFGSSASIYAVRSFRENQNIPQKVWSMFTDNGTAKLKCDLVSVINAGSESANHPAEKSTFAFTRASGPGGQFIPPPFQPSDYHGYDKVEKAGIGTFTQIVRKDVDGSNRSSDITLSCRANVVGQVKGPLLAVDFSKADASLLGFVSYEKADYSLQAFRGSSAKMLKPRFGVGIANDKLYVVNNGITTTLTTNTAFPTNQPVYLFYENGATRISQSLTDKNSGVRFLDVAISSILSGGIGSKAEILAKVGAGDTLLAGYTPSSFIFNPTDKGTYTPATVTTNPDFPYIPSGKGSLLNTFDWRSKEYTIKFKANGSVIEENILSPFYSSGSEFLGISARYTPDGTKHLGGEDNDPYEGWELIKVDFGFNSDGTAKGTTALRNEPYMILYNRFYGTLRVFVYINNSSIANSYKVSLSVVNAPMYDATDSKYKPPHLWSAFLNGHSMDRDDLSTDTYYKTKKLNSSSSGKFYYVDFNMSYDPCVAFFESAIQVSVDKVTTGSMKLVGRSLGGSIPGSEGISNWMEQNGNFVQGALNTPMGNLEQTIGDMTMSNSKNWGMSQLKNYAGFVLPGKKVKDWERKAAELEMASAFTRGAGQTVSAAGTFLKGMGEAASFWQPVGADLGAPFKAAGTYMESVGKFTEAAGTFTQAEALRLRYTNLEDAPDQNIKVTLPDPQPSLVFSDIALQGTLTISSTVLDDIILTTPGSKNANYAPENNLNGSKGSFPLYNEPMGLYALLNKPQVNVSLVRSQDGTSYSAAVALKEHPVVVLNNQPGISQNVFTQIAVTTYNAAGIAINSVASPAYLLTNSPQQLPLEQRLPSQIDITELINESQIEANYQAIGGDSKSIDELKEASKRWVKVQLIVGVHNFGPKLPNGVYSGVRNQVAFEADQKFSFTKSSNNFVGGTAISYLEASYNKGNNSTFGTQYLFGRIDKTFTDLMDDYCQATQTSDIQDAAMRTKNDPDKSARKEKVANKNKEGIKEGIEIYPNPTNGSFKADYTALSTGEIKIFLRDINGRILVEHLDYSDSEMESKEAHFELATLNSGIYIVQVVFSNGKTYAVRVAKK